MDQAVVLCSGGLNSAVLTAVAAQEYRLALLHVRWNHRAAQREAACFADLEAHFKPAERLIIDMPFFSAIGGNSRVDPAAVMEPFTGARDRLSTTFVPGLIGSLASAAYAWACKLGATRVFLGVCENLGGPAPRTASVWPDYSREYAYYWNHLYNAGSMDRTVVLETPLIDLDRPEIIRLGQRLAVPFDHTWSCLAADDEACGQCLGCATRAKGFIEAGAADPLSVKVAA